MSKKINIRNLNIEELTTFIEGIGEKKFRAKQLFEWFWKKNITLFDEISSLPKNFREKLNNIAFIDKIKLNIQQKSNDKTLKFTFKTLEDNQLIEGVLIPTSSRITACISSQAGCSLSCKFCATGKLDLKRNLSSGEIVDQLIFIKKIAESEYKQNLTNIVYMGMGEPLLNYKNVLQSINIITSKEGLEISPRRITLSTAGIAKMIKKLGDDHVKFNLALSLHAANDEKRSKIMEINESNNLDSLTEAIIYFHEKTGSRITYEYVMLKDFNDSIEDASELAEFCKSVPCKINLIEYNPTGDGMFSKSDKEKVDSFASFLESKNLIVNVRRSRGKDIDAACGQLANKIKEQFNNN